MMQYCFTFKSWRYLTLLLRTSFFLSTSLFCLRPLSSLYFFSLFFFSAKNLFTLLAAFNALKQTFVYAGHMALHVLVFSVDNNNYC